MQDNSSCCISNHREEMTVVYVKLSGKNPVFYETFDSALSTFDSTNTPLIGTPYTPYIDTGNISHGKNLEKMKRLIIG